MSKKTKLSNNTTNYFFQSYEKRKKNTKLIINTDNLKTLNDIARIDSDLINQCWKALQENDNIKEKHVNIYLHGASTIVDIAPPKTLSRYMKYNFFDNDSDAIQSDFKAVENDLWGAIFSYEHNKRVAKSG